MFCRSVPVCQTRVQLLVENAGRVNYGTTLGEHKGVEKIFLKDRAGKIHALTHFDIVPLAWEPRDLSRLPWYRSRLDAGPRNEQRPRLLRATWGQTVPASDTYLDVRGWGRGAAFLNGQPLGRFSREGPQHHLYVPGCWIKPTNELVIFETGGVAVETVRFAAGPLWD